MTNVPGRLDLPSIDRKLRDLEQHFDAINLQLKIPHDPLTDDVRENLMLGYQYVDGLIAQNIQLIKPGQSKYLLLLNAVVLFGHSAESQDTIDKFVAANEKRFYDRAGGGVEDFIETLEELLGEDPLECAAAAYVHLLSQPQLFSEGNHRTGALITTYILASHGLPPVVLTPGTAARYFNLSMEIKEHNRNTLTTLFKLRQLKKQMRELLLQITAASPPKALTQPQ